MPKQDNRLIERINRLMMRYPEGVHLRMEPDGRIEVAVFIPGKGRFYGVSVHLHQALDNLDDLLHSAHEGDWQ